ncbi:MAG: long-chain fatty acid--CoA ligase, partial [Gemmatimonadetes bacterium]|nr:long-chain fatty acid--CoA ligase [Gemmatimonadota bacterium]
VASEIAGGEDEVMLAIVPAEGARLDPSALGALVDPLLPRFARPRFIGIVQELPRTATGKVQRNVLRQLGTRGAHDRFPSRP